jgi:hypothetical protein
MKKVLFSLLLSMFLFTSVALAGGEGDASLSVMTLSVKKAKSTQTTEQIKSRLMTLKGVKSVEATAEGTVVVKYNKSELGCCSAIHNALQTGKVKYSMVSNEERPACGNHNSNGGACTKKKES